MAFPFQNDELTVGADGIQVFFGEKLSLQILLLQHEPVPGKARIFADIVGHKVQGALSAVAFKAHSQIRILKADACGHMDMGVHDGRHEELSPEIRNLSIVL